MKVAAVQLAPAYLDREATRTELEALGCPLLSKPIEGEQLANALQQALGVAANDAN